MTASPKDSTSIPIFEVAHESKTKPQHASSIRHMHRTRKEDAQGFSFLERQLLNHAGSLIMLVLAYTILFRSVGAGGNRAYVGGLYVRILRGDTLILGIRGIWADSAVRCVWCGEKVHTGVFAPFSCIQGVITVQVSRLTARSLSTGSQWDPGEPGGDSLVCKPSPSSTGQWPGGPASAVCRPLPNPSNAGALPKT